MKKRIAEIRAGGKIIDYPDIEMDFIVNFSDTEEQNTLEAIIYNISPDTAAAFKVGRIYQRESQILLSAGYDDDTGTIFGGNITRVENGKSGTETFIEIEALDQIYRWMEQKIHKTYQATTARAVIDDIARVYGLEFGEYSLPNNISYPLGLTVSGNIQDTLRDLCRDCGTGFYVINGLFYIGGIPKDTVTILNASTGLIGSPERVEDEAEYNAVRWKVKSLLNHRIQPGSRLLIESQTANGRFIVARGRHVKSSDFVTEMEVVE